MKIRQEIKTYLKRAQELNVDPNFYLSEPYLTLIGAECYSDNGWVYIMNEEWCLFPPLKQGMIVKYPEALNTLNYPYHLRKIWSDFEGKHPNYFHSEFLDWEYIFDSTHFNDLSGGKWETYRKNIRKWPKTHSKWEYIKDSPYLKGESSVLLGDWMEKKAKEVQDADLIIRFILSETEEASEIGIHRKYLYHDKQLVAINVWDENYKYINYRYCIVKQGESFLDEFARYLFYTDLEIQIKGKLINDGGSIGNKGLEAFKDKLHPIRKREVHSWFI